MSDAKREAAVELWGRDGSLARSRGLVVLWRIVDAVRVAEDDAQER